MRSYDIVDWGQPLRAHTRDTPTPQGTQVLMAITHCGVCHTDLHIRDGYYDLGAGKKLTLAERGYGLPITLGHEPVGIVAAVGRPGARFRSRPALPHQSMDRLRQLPHVPGRPRQPMPEHALRRNGHLGWLRHSPAAAIAEVSGRHRRFELRKSRAAGVLGTDDLQRDKKVVADRSVRLDCGDRLRRTRLDGAGRAARHRPQSRRRVRYR